MSGDRAHSAAGANKQRLVIVFALTTIYLAAEVVGGIATHSLALLADAGHMLTDVAGLGHCRSNVGPARRAVAGRRHQCEWPWCGSECGCLVGFSLCGCS